MRRFEQYRIKDSVTPLSGATFGRIFGDIDARIHALEAQKITWEQAVREVQEFGLERINGVIEPVLNTANSKFTDIQTELAALHETRAEFEAWWASQGADITALQTRATELEADLASLNGDLDGGWVCNSWDVFYVGTDQFSIAGDVAGHFPEDRMVRAQLSTGYVHAPVLGAFYSAGMDQTLVTLKTPVLNNTISQVNLGILTPGEGSALPGDVARVEPGYMTLWADYNDSSSVTVSPGKVMINGRLYLVDTPINHTVGPSGDNWYWIMAAAPSSGSALTASEITSTTTVPTYDGAKDGWYSADGLKRCIGFVLAQAGALRPSSLQRSILSMESTVVVYSTSSWPSVDTLVTVGPPLKTTNQIGIYIRNNTGALENCNRVFIGNGIAPYSNSGDGFGLIIGDSGITDNTYQAEALRITNSSGQIWTKSDYGQQGSLYIKCVHLPGGFGR